MSNPDIAPTYDPELDILRELEAEFERELTLIARARPRARWRDRVSVRVTRRALVLVGLVCLIGASALAGHSVLSGSPQKTSPPTLLASGGSGLTSWQLESYVYRGTSCYALFAGGTVASKCQATPGRDGVNALSAVDPNERLVAGLAGNRVATVLIEVGKHRILDTTQSQRSGTRAVGLAHQMRWFVAIIPSKTSAAASPPARLTPRAPDGRSLGPPILDCSLGGTSQMCAREADRVATGGSVSRK